MDDKSLSILKHRFFPSFYKNEAPRLIEFMRYYLEWLQGEEQAYWIVNNLKDFTDIDGSIDNYIEHLKNELMIDFPIKYAGDLRYIMKHLVMLYQSKGTLASYKFFFRAMYDSYCDIYYPREEIIKASDGRWIQGYYCYCSAIPLNDLDMLDGRVITEVETGITGLISDLRPYYFLGDEEPKYCLIVTNTRKPLTEGNHFTIEDYEGTFTLEQAEYSDGYWEGTYGFLDSDKVLQDSYYYQNFSYEITSIVPFEEYKDIVQKLIHPAGMKLFGRYQLVEDVEPIGCPTDRDNRTQFLRWWILKMFMLVYANVKTFWRKWYLKWIPETYQFPYTADHQYRNKDYGQVNGVRNFTPNQLYAMTNDSSKLVFKDGILQENLDWVKYLLNEEANTYTIMGIEAEQPVIRTKYSTQDGTYVTITSTKDKPVSSNVNDIWVFVNGKKVYKNNITKITDYDLKIRFDKNYQDNDSISIYSLTTDTTFFYDVVSTSETYWSKRFTQLEGKSKEQFVIFVNGVLVDNNDIEYSITTGNIRISFSNSEYKTIEIYVLKNKEDLCVHKYLDYLLRDNGKRLGTVLPLRNVYYTLPDSFEYWYKKYKAFTMPYNSDQQNYYKQFSTVSTYESLTGTDLMTPTNASCKICFHDGKQFAPDWVNYKTTEDTSVDNVIASLESAYPHIHTTSVEGTIDLSDFWTNELNENFNQLSNYRMFVFVDGLKIRDEQITCKDNKISLLNKESGEADIYFIDPDCFADHVYATCSPLKTMSVYKNSRGTAETVIPYHDDVGKYQFQLDKSDRTLYLPFYNGKFVWSSIENGRLAVEFPEATNAYMEIYRIVKSDKYSVISYIQTKEFTYSNPNNIMLCYNPATNIRP